MCFENVMENDTLSAFSHTPGGNQSKLSHITV